MEQSHTSRASVGPIVIAAFLLLTAPAAFADTLKIATWNIEHLRDGIGEGPNARTQEDFHRLARYAEILGADVIALQEIESLEAAARIFDPAKYQLFIERRDDKLRTGFAVRKGIPAVQNPDYQALNVTGDVRQGTDITITVGGQDIRLLSIHLQSGCWGDPIDTPSRTAESRGEDIPGTVTVSAPVFNHERVVGSVSILGLKPRLQAKELERFRALLLATTGKISRELGRSD